MTLTVATPTVEVDGVTGNVFAAASPITLSCAPVAFDDGRPLTPESAITFGYRLYRRLPGGAEQVWDEENRQWLPQSAPVAPQSLFYRDDLWQTILVAIGQQDASEAPKLQTDFVSRFPKYFARCFFSGTDAAGVLHEGQSGASPDFEVLALGQRDRAGLATVPKDVDEATEIYLFLKDNALSERGVVRIYRDGSGYAIHLDVSGARITLDRQGDITLRPASGRTVRIEGNATVDGDLFVAGTLTP